MELFSFKPLLDYDAETGVVTASLEPSFGGAALMRKDIDTLLEEAGQHSFFMLEDGIDELLITDQTLRAQGQKVFEVFLKKLQQSHKAQTQKVPVMTPLLPKTLTIPNKFFPCWVNQYLA